jgi:iodotyrosine deiodinase
LVLPTIPYEAPRRTASESIELGRQFHEEMATRRSVRDFRPDPVPLSAVEHCIAAASLAPSGANKQPWTFVMVTDPMTKRAIRGAAEREERAFYAGRASETWLNDVEPLGTGPEKPFLEAAPVLIAVFAQRHGAGTAERHYYVTESVGIAVGFLLVALHRAGFAALTHTPAPMEFLRELLGRPDERAGVLPDPGGLSGGGLHRSGHLEEAAVGGARPQVRTGRGVRPRVRERAEHRPGGGQPGPALLERIR